MATSPENYLADASKASLETLENISNSTLDNTEKLSTLNLETARNSFDQQMEGTLALMQARNFQDFLALQNTLTRPVLQNTINYCSSAYAIANESQQELRRLAENGYAEFSKSVNSILDRAAQAAPGSSDVVIAAVKSAMNAANSAYNKMSDAAQNAKEIAEGGAQASANATSKAIGAVVTKSKKK